MLIDCPIYHWLAKVKFTLTWIFDSQIFACDYCKIVNVKGIHMVVVEWNNKMRSAGCNIRVTWRYLWDEMTFVKCVDARAEQWRLWCVATFAKRDYGLEAWWYSWCAAKFTRCGDDHQMRRFIWDVAAIKEVCRMALDVLLQSYHIQAIIKFKYIWFYVVN